MANERNRTNYSVLPFYTAKKYQNAETQARLGYGAYGSDVWPLVADLYHTPPFQVIRPTDEGKGVEISSFVLVDEFGAEYTMTINIVTETFADYDILSYGGIDAMSGETLSAGVYYAKLSWGFDLEAVTIYSEKFEMKPHPLYLNTNFLKIRFWHSEPFVIPIGHISYSDPFYNFVYLQTVINKPKFRREDTNEPNDGYIFPVYQISQKTFGFNGWVPEYMLDILRLIEQHDYKVIEFDEIIYYPVYFKIDIDEDAEREGHVWHIKCEFEIDGPTQTTGRITPEGEGFEYDQSEYDNSEFD